MFPTRDFFNLSLDALKIMSQPIDGGLKRDSAEILARDMFMSFDEMTKLEQKEVIDMLIEDLSKGMYELN